MRIRRSLISLTLSLAGFGMLAASAQGEEAPAPAPAWKVTAAVAPTHLPPKQSEVQRLTVEAEGGTFTLSLVTEDEGEGTLSYGKGLVLSKITAGAEEITFFSVTGGTAFEEGQEVIGTGIAAGTTVEHVSVDGKTIELSQPTEGDIPGFSYITGASKQVGGVSGSFHEGDALSGEGIPAGTTVDAVGAGTLTLSQFPTKGGPQALTATETTEPVAYDATPEGLQGALEGLPAFEPGMFTASGGPGGDAGNPYFIAFGGPYAYEDVEEFVVDGGELAGQHAETHVLTVVPGGPGTGEIGIFPTEVGGADSAGAITVELGPLPPGIVTAGPGESADGSWTCPGGAGESTFTCTRSEPVEALTMATSITVPVEVEDASVPDSTVPVSVSGGGASEAASFQMPLVVSAEPAQAGIQAFWFGAFDAAGSPSTQAGGHPYGVLTEFALNTVRSKSGKVVPAGDLRDVLVDLPPGLLGDPLVTDRCPQSLVAEGFTGGAPACNVADNSLGLTEPIAASFGGSSHPFPIFNDVPVFGTAAEFSTRIVQPVQSLIASLRTEGDFGIRVGAPRVANLQKVFRILTAFRGLPEAAGGKAFFRNATDCAEEARRAPVARMSASSWQRPGDFDEATDARQPVTGCDKLSFNPGFSFQPTNANGSSGTGADAHLHIDQSGLTDPEKLGTPDLKRSVVKLPAGLSVNPSQANGLAACSEAQVGYVGSGDLPNPTRFNENPVTCPDASKLGTVEATTPLLEEPLKGTIYLAKQNDNPFNSLIGLYLVIESPRFGITLKLPGKVDLDPGSGQMTATFDYVPQQPVEDLTLRFRGGGPRSTLATPEVCGRYSTHGEWEPWSAPQSGPSAQTSDSFNVSSNCASSAGARPFNPSFEAGSTSTLAGGFSPLVVKVTRNDGEQELNRLDFTMPPGFAAKLAGVPYCSDADIAAAQGKSGKDEQSSPSCPDAAKLGSTDAAAGVGGEPFHAPGTIYLAGPYKGAPLSAVVITPAVAGPFDLGNVVIRTPLSIDPVTAQVSADSDPIPTILKGIPLKLREVAIKIDKGDFSLNPTNCEAMKITASLGSSNGASASPENRFQVGGCKGLDFKPHMRLTLKGGTKRTAHPKLIAEVFSKGIGVANLARIQTKLPRSAFLDQAHIRTVCTRVQFAAGGGNGERCPKGSVYGRAWVKSPLFDYWLSGNAYLRSSNHKLPDLVLAIHGPASQPIAVELAGKTDSVKGALRNTFEGVPDAPFDKARLVLFGGKRGLVVNSRNLCRQSKRNSRANVRLSGQNGKVSQLHPIVRNDCGRAAKKKHKRHHKRGH